MSTSAAALSEAFRDRSVFLTGHTGFKGSWLALWLQQLGAKVSGYSLAPPTSPSNFEVSGIAESLAGHYEGDVRDFQQLSAALDESDPDVVLHLAAQPLVRESYATPRETFESNVMGTCNLLEAVRNRSRPCVVVVVTTDKCYENCEHVWGYRECDPMGGHDPYSASKGAAELVVSSYRRSFFSPDQLAEHGVKLASARAGNVIGGGDWAKDRIVTDIVRHLANHEPVPVRSPRAVRPWQHVLEPLSGYLALAAKMLASDDSQWCDAWNFGPETVCSGSVSDLVEAFCQEWGDGSWLDLSDPRQPHEANLLRLSIEKAITQLQWKPVWDFTQTIARTARWYHSYSQGDRPSMRDACLEDIAAYLACSAQADSTPNPVADLAPVAA